MMGFLHGKVEYVVTAVLVTNVASALTIPLALPFLLGTDVQISVWEVLEPVLTVMFAPLILAYLVARFSPKAHSVLRKGKIISFPLWLVNLFIISANAANFLRNEYANSAVTLITIALVSLVICIINFSAGAFLGGPHYWQEASQSLGQKNLAFVVWIALTFINPLVAMGPMFYILYHHLYNSWSIYRYERGIGRRTTEVVTTKRPL
jgi:BASS family bile acid:Na+ symporter